MFDLSRFGIKVFNEKIMKMKLPSPIYKKWMDAMKNKTCTLDRTTADAIAHAMKEWAIEQGCTHYCHWFQPLTGTTAEKHDAFIDIRDGEPILKFSGKNLIQGEPDASSFPSGGLRSTFEARGYTYWDCSSPVFIRGNTLCVPTIFVGFKGETLDMKWPLLKSIDAISEQATRIMHLFGNKEVTSVMPSLGLEQEYFLVDRNDFLKREDLMMTGRTLFGAMPSKGQELETHYFGAIPERVQKFMEDVNTQLWELGIYAKSEHNEVAPAQFELAPIFGPVNIAVDQNAIIMDVLQRTALQHDLVCLLHEKPFKGVNGSGKHNNWSLITNTEINLLSPNKENHDNTQFLIFISSIIQAIDQYATLIRMAASNPGNDYRLGANEAPPAIVSIFLGNQIEDLLTKCIASKPTTFKKNSSNEFGISSLSYLPHDSSDRNRTSPVAFTGNKFEFRMLGSSMNASYLNTVINTVVADSLKSIADQLETYKNQQERRKASTDICAEIMKKHGRILFSGNGYSDEWVMEAKKRGLNNIHTYVESLRVLEDDSVLSLFEKYKIYKKEELLCRLEVQYEEYYKVRLIEVKTLLHLVYSELIPTLNNELKQLNQYMPITEYAKEQKDVISASIDKIYVLSKKLENNLTHLEEYKSTKEKGLFLLNNLTPIIDDIRDCFDHIELRLSKNSVNYPTYMDLFFRLDY